VHGEAVGVMLPHVIRFNSKKSKIAALYRKVYDGDLPGRIQELLRLAKMPVAIRHYGVKKGDFRELAEMAAKQWTAQFNPRSLTVGDFEKLYRAAW